MTAELAVALVPVAVLLLLAAWLAAAGTAQVRVQLAAGAAARALARGEDPGLVAGRVTEVVGGAVLTVRQDGGLVRVDVSAPVSAPLLGAVGSLHGSAAAPLEADAQDAP
ncbi:TadE family type IV pilus minor pilin [Quadrisphaera sp. KR29]|uniref:TadE family type IV pilus minor pilin n=1 Tax=Quadrisphaera sp. KR29 TaxID=3461391 RepID=UPI004044B638